MVNPMILRYVSFRAVPLLAAVASASFAVSAGAQASAKPMNATAILIDTGGHKVGTVKLSDTPKGLTIKGNVQGLAAGTHAVHLHTVGKCDQPDFLTAGPHFNPTNMQHGS